MNLQKISERIIYVIGIVFIVAMALSFALPADAQYYGYADDYYGYGGWDDYGGYYGYADDYYGYGGWDNSWGNTWDSGWGGGWDDCFDCYGGGWDTGWNTGWGWDSGWGYADCFDCYDYYPDYSYCSDCYTGGGSAGSIYINNTNTNTNVNNNNNGGNNNNVDLNVYCQPNYSVASIGETVTWYANVSGGSGNYNYSWSGTDGLSGNGSSVTKSYNSRGNKNASVTVSSGGKTASANCGGVFIEDNRIDLNVVCRVSDRTVERGESVTWYVDVYGGSGNYSYEWSGTSPLDGRTGRSVTVSYNSTGTKYGSVTVRSGNESRNIDCGTVRVEDDRDDDDDDDHDWSVSCKASPSRVDEGETVRWIAETDGVSESRVDFNWSRDADGDDEEVTERYNRAGTYEARVTARYNGETKSDTCTVRVEDDRDDDRSNVVVTRTTPTTPTYVPPSLSSVYLSQVPYTGAADTAKIVGFITMLTLASLGGAYYMVTKKARSDRKSFIERFKQDNLAKRA